MKKVDRRTKFGKFCVRWFNKNTRAAFVAGILAGSLIMFAYLDGKNTAPKPVETMITPEVVLATDKFKERGYAFCFDPIICIRDVGEELGFDNQTIMTAIRIARSESNFNQYAKNKTSTAKGIYQFIDGTWRAYCLKDGNVYDYEDNIRCFYKVLKTDGVVKGLKHWNASRDKWSK